MATATENKSKKEKEKQYWNQGKQPKLQVVWQTSTHTEHDPGIFCIDKPEETVTIKRAG